MMWLMILCIVGLVNITYVERVREYSLVIVISIAYTYMYHAYDEQF